MNNKKIDIVYLWVDDTDKKWINLKNKYLHNAQHTLKTYTNAIGDERFRDNGELKYSLRSVAECVPWINHIYIVTGFNQKPKWLNTKNKKISIISHEQIMPKEALPTFNATAIEMCISNIPNLSERFLLMNDDTFFNKKLTPDFFFDKHGRARVRYSSYTKHPKNIINWINSVDEYTQTLILSSKIIENLSGKKIYYCKPSHGIDPYIKSSIKECKTKKIIKEQISRQVVNKFRTNDEIQRWAFNLYDFIMKRATFTHAHPYKYNKQKCLDFIYNLIHWHNAKESNIVCTNIIKAKRYITKAPTFCINDSSENDTTILQANIDFLKERFSKKSEFEL